MYVLVGPEMALGRPKDARHDSWANSTPQPPSKTTGTDTPAAQKMRRSSMSTLSLTVKAASSAIRRSASLRGPKAAFHSGPIIIDDAPSLAPIRVHSPINLNKPLPDLPDDSSSRSGGKQGGVGAEIDTDVSVSEFEGYLDMLSYVNRQLPVVPSPLQPTSRDVCSSPSLSISSPPKEDEWISSRAPSRASTIFSCNDEVRRVRTHSGLLCRNSPAGRTVTPMSSLGSESGLRISRRASLRTSVVTSKIDELSEPETSSCLTPKHDAMPSPKLCCHCGRYPDKQDTTDVDSDHLVAVKIQNETDINSSPLTVINIRKHDKDWGCKTTGPTITAKDSLGRRFVLYPETCYFVALDGSCSDPSETCAGRTPPSAEVSPSSPLTPTPYARKPNPGSYADEDPPSKRAISPYRRPPNPEPSTTTSSPSDEAARHGGTDRGQDDSDTEEEPGFWKDPAGTIVVYEGIARDGDEVFYGSDINYLGSFYDAEEGSSGLGSAVELVGLSSGLHVIHEDRSSEDLAMWDNDVLTFS